MMNRREFLQLSAYMTLALKTGMIGSISAAASAPQPLIKGLSGMIIAASINPTREGPYSREYYGTTLARLDLETGKSKSEHIKLNNPHDVVKVKDHYMVLPNADKPIMHFTDLSGQGEDIYLDGNKSVSGHGFYDEKNNVVLVSTVDFDKNRLGAFAVLDPDDHRLLDLVEIDGYSPHDINLIDEDTLAVCNYNIKSFDNTEDSGFAMKLHDNQSYLSLYDRKTLKLKTSIPAYQQGMISHATVTNEGDLYAVGFQDYYDSKVAKWDGDYIEDKFRSFFADNHPELSSQWSEISQQTKIHRVEKSVGNFGLPLLPLRLEKGANTLDVLPVEHFHHRRAQSICHVKYTNTVCMAFPHSDSIMLYNANTHRTHHLSGIELNLKEMRGISEIEGTPYLAIAGIRRGITIIDTSTYKNVKHYDVAIGRIVHMHHIA